MWPSSRKTRMRGLFRRSVLGSISGVCSRKEEYYQNIIWSQLVDGTLNSKIWQLDITWFFWTNLLANVEAPVGIEPILISLPRVQQCDFDNACRSSSLSFMEVPTAVRKDTSKAKPLLHNGPSQGIIANSIGHPQIANIGLQRWS